ncbi:hypothetical protein GPY51_10895 [Photorhabdus laumondii subsp. laumondii]|uniref:Uncharacterized protein n=2 Tax=Photorhabdus TaxID=29487 RepID=A0A6L9JRL0_PHOLM|nr:MULTISPECIES: hypothetical protein [Photorhabdus]KER01091.1 hypothetical protein MEG1DRAFT_04301 [Photorhabdus temperata subsp. temperata Meg1]MCC8384618.1 hypothetical protein [Photorhabdus laumondii]MCC8413336.1 hypothetical protein [Photorhabdus laumondii]MCC8421968.1 hypothetical protein [Photorhabdus thracensis]NDK95002.1 hypothetical protein [Photorhabdus laumondii subsp. laumondii]
MELEKLLNEIRDIKNDIKRIEQVIPYKANELCISVLGNLCVNAPADKEFLIDALNSKKIELTERLNKLNEAKQMSEKIISGLIA